MGCFCLLYTSGAARIQINDAGGTPGIAQLRLEQAVEVSEQ